MWSAMLGYMESGAAYVPLDDTEERLKLMLADSGAEVGITEEDSAMKNQRLGCGHCRHRGLIWAAQMKVVAFWST